MITFYNLKTGKGYYYPIKVKNFYSKFITFSMLFGSGI